MRKLHRNPTETELKEMISSVDDNGDGAIDFDEFLVLMKSRVGEGGPDKDLRLAFSQFDSRGKGYIDRETLKLIMAEFDQPLTEDECNAIFAQADSEKRGRITFPAFKELMVRFFNRERFCLSFKNCSNMTCVRHNGTAVLDMKG